MSDGQVPKDQRVPESIIVRWSRRPSTISSAIAGMQSGGYLLVTGLLNVALVVAAHRQVFTSPILAASGAIFFFGSAITYRVASRRVSGQQFPGPEPSPVELRDRVLARMNYDVVSAYPTRYAALRFFPVFGIVAIASFALTIWTDVVVWPFAAGSGVSSAIALIVFLVANRQYRRDLRWALDYEEPKDPPGPIRSAADHPET